MHPFVTTSVLIFWHLPISLIALYLLPTWPARVVWMAVTFVPELASIPAARSPLLSPCCPPHLCHEGVCPCKEKWCREQRMRCLPRAPKGWWRGTRGLAKRNRQWGSVLDPWAAWWTWWAPWPGMMVLGLYPSSLQPTWQSSCFFLHQDHGGWVRPCVNSSSAGVFKSTFTGEQRIQPLLKPRKIKAGQVQRTLMASISTQFPTNSCSGFNSCHT